MQFEDVLTAKLNVVDGLSFLACEVAIGLFEKKGWDARKQCRSLGFEAPDKGSLVFSDFRATLKSKGVPFWEAHGLDVDPLDYYLTNRGFGVTASKSEIQMARFYLVSGLSYENAEERVGLSGERGWKAMYGVCKLGGFRGPAERAKMSSREFDERTEIIGLS
jgi:hypothetical protein